MAWSSEDLKNDYDEKAPLYNSLCEELSKQIEELLRDASVALAVPLEARVKTLDSLLDKCERNSLEPEALSEIAPGGNVLSAGKSYRAVVSARLFEVTKLAKTVSTYCE